MAYTILDNSNPAVSQAGTAAIPSALANDKALRDAILMGQMAGFAFSVSGGTASEPAIMYWKNATTSVWLRATLTWGTTGGENGQLKTIVWDLSINAGSDYTTAPGGNIGTETLSYDSSGNLTATTIASGLMSWTLALIGKLKQHIAATGTAAHGLGSISTQSASSVAITGGTVAGVTVTGSSVDATRVRQSLIDGGSISGSTSINWGVGAGHYRYTVTGAGATFTHANLPNGVFQEIIVRVTNGGLASSLMPGVKYAGGGAPPWTSSGVDIIRLGCYQGSTVEVIGWNKDVK